MALHHFLHVTAFLYGIAFSAVLCAACNPVPSDGDNRKEGQMSPTTGEDAGDGNGVDDDDDDTDDDSDTDGSDNDDDTADDTDDDDNTVVPPECDDTNDSGWAIGSNVLIEKGSQYADNPSVVWTGEEYGVLYEVREYGYRGLYLRRVDASGAPIGERVKIYDSEESGLSPSLAWSGSEYGVSWSSTREIDGHSTFNFARFASDGELVGSVVEIDNARRGTHTRLVWNGTEYGLAWLTISLLDEEDDTITFARISKNGEVVGAPIDVVADNVPSWRLSSTFSFIPAADGYAITWTGEFVANVSTFYFARLSKSGTVLGSPMRMGDTQRGVATAWNGTNYAVMWEDRDNDGHIALTLLSQAGVVTGPPLVVEVTDAHVKQVAVTGAGTGTGFTMVWGEHYPEDEQQGDYGNFLGMVSGDGELKDRFRLLDSWPGSHLSLIRHDDTYALAYGTLEVELLRFVDCR